MMIKWFNVKVAMNASDSGWQIIGKVRSDNNKRLKS